MTAYDRNGNILGLQRYGRTGADSYGLVDELALTLDGNQLSRVYDAAGTHAYGGGFEFRDGADRADEYAYDANGNLVKDLNKDILRISYNSLNLPDTVRFGDGSTISYVYACDSTKVRAVHRLKGTVTTTDYRGHTVYENGVARRILTDEGYVSLPDKKFHYYLKDHQGNNRVVIGESGEVEEVNHYYPSGGMFAGTESVQPYKYNGKEFDGSCGLDWYDYGARRYDAALGRFTTFDPMAEKDFPWSPYLYCNGSPVLHVDKEGKFLETVWDAFNVALGIKSFKDNIQAGNYLSAALDGVGIVADAVATLVPVIPGGASSAIKAGRAADKAADALKAMERGRASEAKVLKDIGATKNTRRMTVEDSSTGKMVTVIPDGVTDGKLIEIKDAKSVYNTTQIRGELEAAQGEHKKFELITGEKTHVSGKILDNDKIQVTRRKDLGPQ